MEIEVLDLTKRLEELEYELGPRVLSERAPIKANIGRKRRGTNSASPDRIRKHLVNGLIQ